ncbi:MAG: haloacid dehalogenase [Anaerolineaceae bacterium]|jgi:translin|nr:haloacid dehalogenase [Anaerolineaceae bacterium]MDD4043501.1 haloacid dehalogenase [Anaerolineaceae bacterium]MDD4577246.1 haloacid dehalogenase [Anaerolineaceae bacterium]
MRALDKICDDVRTDFENKTALRDEALRSARQCVKHASLAIRAIHRNEETEARQELIQGRELVDQLRSNLKDAHPELYFAGYTQDAVKEYCEAELTVAMILGLPLPTPADLNAENPAYLNGLAETLGELRRRCLDLLRPGYNNEVERLLELMDEVFTQLVTMDYPDAITEGLRRRTDLARGIIERTRADITVAYREEQLAKKLDQLSQQLSNQG